MLLPMQSLSRAGSAGEGERADCRLLQVYVPFSGIRSLSAIIAGRDKRIKVRQTAGWNSHSVFTADLPRSEAKLCKPLAATCKRLVIFPSEKALQSDCLCIFENPFELGRQRVCGEGRFSAGTSRLERRRRRPRNFLLPLFWKRARRRYLVSGEWFPRSSWRRPLTVGPWPAASRQLLGLLKLGCPLRQGMVDSGGREERLRRWFACASVSSANPAPSGPQTARVRPAFWVF